MAGLIITPPAGGGGGGISAVASASDVAISSASVGKGWRYANGKWRDAIPDRLNLWDFVLDQLAGSAYSPSYRLYGCSITSGQKTLTCAVPQFAAGMVGQAIRVDQAGAAGAVLVTTVAAYTSATSVTLTDAAGSTVSAKGVARIVGTDVSSAVDAWLAALGTAAAATPGGAMGVVPPGHFLVGGNHQIPDDVWIEGAGEWRSLLMLKASAGAGVDVLRSNGFATYTGQTGTTNANRGARGFGLSRLGIDGNFRANSTARYGLALYGFDYFLKDVVVTTCTDAGIYSELNMTGGNTPHQYGSGPGGLHCYWDRVLVQNCADASGGTRAQVKFFGPHDSYVRGLDVYKDGNFSDYGIWIGASGVGGGVDGGGGSQWSDIHVWGNHTTGVYINSGGTLMDNIQSEGGNLQLKIGGTKIKVNHARLYGVTGTAADEGLEIASGSDIQVTSLKVEDCDVAAVRFTAGGTNSLVAGTASSDNATPPPLVAGTPATTCEIDLIGVGGYNKSLRQRGGGHAVANADVALAAGWGTTASVAVASGSNVYRGQIAITSGGTGQAATPLATLTFPKAFTAAPYAVCTRINTPSGSSSFFSVGTISSTAVQFFYSGTPAGGTTYTLHYWVME